VKALSFRLVFLPCTRSTLPISSDGDVFIHPYDTILAQPTHPVQPSST
jgi:hypothetical protein